jgi:hypothetical protein
MNEYGYDTTIDFRLHGEAIHTRCVDSTHDDSPFLNEVVE